MRPWHAIFLLAAVLVGGCGGGGRSTEDVVRAWSSALNAGDNESAADLFAPGARIVQLGRVTTLTTHDDAVRWNSALPCSGRIVQLERSRDNVTATFVLGNRKTSLCDAPGGRATAVFMIRGGKIVLWHQVPSPPTSGEEV